MFANAMTERMAAFVCGIGIDVRVGRLPADTFLPGRDIQHRAIVVDEERLAYPDDLLHPAGHFAVAEVEACTEATPSPPPGNEMAMLAWSYAVLRALDLACGGNPGVPLLAYYGMTVEAQTRRHAASNPILACRAGCA